MKVINRIDRCISRALEWSTSTKSAFYFLSLLIIAAVIINPPTTIEGWLLVAVSIYYQGVALPGLGASNVKESAEIRRLLQETHDTVMEELAEMKKIHSEIHTKHRKG